jgi:hypothetical protein
LKHYLAHTNDKQVLEFTLKEVQGLINSARQSELLSDDSLHIFTADEQHFYINIPTVKAETIFPIEKGYATGRKILDEKSRDGTDLYLCKDGKIRELPPPRSCA